MTVELDVKTFEERVKEGVLLVDFWAPWCAPCRAFAPVYEEVSGEHPDATFGKVNTEDQPELAGAFNIRAIPTLMAFRDGILVFSQAGMLPPDALRELVGAIKALDMDEVRREIDAAKQAEEKKEEKKSRIIMP